MKGKGEIETKPAPKSEWTDDDDESRFEGALPIKSGSTSRSAWACFESFRMEEEDEFC